MAKQSKVTLARLTVEPASAAQVPFAPLPLELILLSERWMALPLTARTAAFKP